MERIREWTKLLYEKDVGVLGASLPEFFYYAFGLLENVGKNFLIYFIYVKLFLKGTAKIKYNLELNFIYGSSGSKKPITRILKYRKVVCICS